MTQNTLKPIKVLALLLAISLSFSAWGNTADLLKKIKDVDSRLNQAYKDTYASRDKDAKKRLKDDQRNWLAQRDKECELKSLPEDSIEKWRKALAKHKEKTECVIGISNKRVRRLEAIGFTSPETMFEQRYQTKFPPYPDVWLQRLGGMGKSSRPNYQVWKTATGDMRIIYPARDDDMHVVFNVLDIFSGDLDYEEGKNFDATWRKLFAKQKKLGSQLSRIAFKGPILSSGAKIVGVEPQFSRPICHTWSKRSFKIYPPDAKKPDRKVLLIRRRQPVKMVAHNPECEPDYTEYVFTASLTYFQELNDGSIVTSDSKDGGYIIRFDRNLSIPNISSVDWITWIDKKEFDEYLIEGYSGKNRMWTDEPIQLELIKRYLIN